MPIRQNEPYLLSQVRTINGEQYTIIEHKSYGYELQRLYTIHISDVEKGLMGRKPIHRVYLPYSDKNRYRNYYKKSLGILSYAISMGKFIPGQTYKQERLYLNFNELDKWFRMMKNDIKNGDYDSQSIYGPEL